MATGICSALVFQFLSTLELQKSIFDESTTARRQGKARAVLARKFRVGRKNSCDALVAEFFVRAEAALPQRVSHQSPVAFPYHRAWWFW
jgi:hypothetical protein